MPAGIIDFLETGRDIEELRAALAVLEEFKLCESHEEFIAIPFAAWAKLEQLEEFLEHLVHGKELREDTKELIERNHNAE